MHNPYHFSTVTLQRRGYVSTLLVIVTGLICISILGAAYELRINSQDGQRVAQVKADYSQREDAILRALVGIVPNKAMKAMQNGSSGNAASFSWQTIFEEAIATADAESALSAAEMTALGVPAGARNGNSGDSQITSIATMISAVVGNGLVTPGIGSDLGGDYPPTLNYSGSADDATYPIISINKDWDLNSAGYTALSTSVYPDFNLIPYPQIRFGYVAPGEYFVAKRNWWAFNITYGAGDSAVTGIPQETRTYVLSIYEVPSQLPISADAFTEFGKYADGKAWSTDVDIDGGVYAETVRADSAMAFDRAASRKGFDASGGMTVGGETVSSGFQTDGSQDTKLAASGEYFAASVSANAGRVAFISINPGFDFYQYLDVSKDLNTVSDTAWSEYALGGHQAKMQLIVNSVSATNDQLPTSISLIYNKDGKKTETWTRGDSSKPWLTKDQGGDAIPFQTEVAGGATPCLTVKMDVLEEFLEGEGASLTDNNSIVINPDSAKNLDIIEPTFPSTDGQMGVVLRGAQDLTGWSKGFSLVTNLRLYIAEDFNIIEGTPPGNSGLDASEPYYPPISLFSPEKRWGADVEAKVIDFKGTVQSLNKAGTDAAPVNPLDFKIGTGQSLSSGDLSADLNLIRSPAELPPIHMMNWLVTIERVQ